MTMEKKLFAVKVWNLSEAHSEVQSLEVNSSVSGLIFKISWFNISKSMWDGCVVRKFLL